MADEAARVPRRGGPGATAGGPPLPPVTPRRALHEQVERGADAAGRRQCRRRSGAAQPRTRHRKVTKDVSAAAGRAAGGASTQVERCSPTGSSASAGNPPPRTPPGRPRRWGTGRTDGGPREVAAHAPAVDAPRRRPGSASGPRGKDPAQLAGAGPQVAHVVKDGPTATRRPRPGPKRQASGPERPRGGPGGGRRRGVPAHPGGGLDRHHARARSTPARSGDQMPSARPDVDHRSGRASAKSVDHEGAVGGGARDVMARPGVADARGVPVDLVVRAVPSLATLALRAMSGGPGAGQRTVEVRPPLATSHRLTPPRGRGRPAGGGPLRPARQSPGCREQPTGRRRGRRRRACPAARRWPPRRARRRRSGRPCRRRGRSR